VDAVATGIETGPQSFRTQVAIGRAEAQAWIDAGTLFLARALPKAKPQVVGESAASPGTARTSAKGGAPQINLLRDDARPQGQSLVYTDPERYARTRSQVLQESLPPKSRGRVTMSAGVVEAPDGTRRVLVGTSEPRGYIRRGVRDEIKPSETVVRGKGHAESDIVQEATAHGESVVTVGAGRPHCPGCVEAIEESGGSTASARRKRR
jgi:filamentous hemagglutinin